jgi:hypothetical protein
MMMMTTVGTPPSGIDPNTLALLLQAGQAVPQPPTLDPNTQALFQTYFPSVPAGFDANQTSFNPQNFLGQPNLNPQANKQFGSVTFNTNHPTLGINQDLANNKAFTNNINTTQGLQTGNTPTSTGSDATAVAGTRATVLGRFQPNGTGAALAANYGVGNANANGVISALIPGADGRYGNDNALLKSSMSSLLAPLQSVLQATQANTTTGKQLIQQGQTALQQQQYNQQLQAMYKKQQQALEASKEEQAPPPEASTRSSDTRSSDTRSSEVQ